MIGKKAKRRSQAPWRAPDAPGQMAPRDAATWSAAVGADADFTPRDMGLALGELGREIGGQVLDDLGRPEFRAGLGASMLTAALLARARLPAVAVVVTSVLVGAAVEQAFGMMADVHESLTERGAPFSLRVHEGNLHCWGHEAGNFPLDCPDGPRNADS